MKPLIRLLGIGRNDEDDYSRARVLQLAIASASSELEKMASGQLISRPVHEQLRRELDSRLENMNTTIDSILGENQDRLSEEFQIARSRLSVAEKSAIEQAMHDGWVSATTASKMIDETDLHSGKSKTIPKPRVAEQG
jgi:hypothetical protein